MPSLAKFRVLDPRSQALVSLAVLIDGHDAGHIISGGEADINKSSSSEAQMAEAAEDLAKLSPELRVPLLGSLLRGALEQLEEEL